LNGESLVSWTETEEKEKICNVLETVRKQNPGQRILLVLYKRGSHICEHTRKRAHRLGIDLIFLPSGSPHLNLIEQEPTEMDDVAGYRQRRRISRTRQRRI
jgi:hypothetical protein